MMNTVVHFTDGDSFGGAEQMLLHMVGGLDRERWRPVLFHHPGPDIEPLLARARELDLTLRSVPKIQTLLDIKRFPELIGAIRAERPTIFHAHFNWPLSCKYGLFAASIARVPIVIASVHSCQEFPRRQFLLRMQPRLIATAVDLYLAVSEASAQLLCNTYRIPPWKVHVVRNGIRLEAFERASPLGTAARKRPIVLMTGRLSNEKGHRYLLMAAALVPQTTFVFAGEGPERKSLERQAKDLGIEARVIFLGYREDIPDLLANCDVFVLPSLCEALPVSVLEAMAACKPVIVTAVGGNKEVVVDGETGLVVPPADPAALAKAITAILSDSGLARRLAVAGKALVKHEFSAELMVRKVTNIYNQLINGGTIAHAPI
jgi:glycosyltransferase involved in cell wall biosynthesis